MTPPATDPREALERVTGDIAPREKLTLLCDRLDTENSTEAILAGLRDVAGWLENEKRNKHARTIRHGIERLTALDPSRQELRAILHQAFSHPEAADHSGQVAGQPMLVKTDRGWYVLGEDGARFNLVSCMTPADWVLVPREPTPRMVEVGGQMLPPTERLSDCYEYFRDAWTAALAAAPGIEAVGEDAQRLRAQHESPVGSAEAPPIRALPTSAKPGGER